MTDTAKLEQYIRDSGLKRCHIAKVLGLSPHGLAKKIHNKTEFKAEEIAKLCDLLGISSYADREAVFFCHRVD